MKLRFIVAFLMSFPLCAQQVTTCLDYTPFTLNEENEKQWNGPNVETLYYITEAMNMTLDASIRAPFARCIELLKQGKIDVMPGLIYTKEREKFLHLVEYGSKDQLAVFFLKDSKTKIELDNLLSSQVIGMHRAFALPDHIKQSELVNHLTPITTVDTGLAMVLKGRIDGVLATIPTGEAIINEWPEMQNKFTYTPLALANDKRIYLAISRQSFLAGHIKTIQKTIKKLAKKPELAHLQINTSY